MYKFEYQYKCTKMSHIYMGIDNKISMLALDNETNGSQIWLLPYMCQKYEQYFHFGDFKGNFAKSNKIKCEIKRK